MALEQAFNLDLVKSAPSSLSNKSLQDATDWLAALATGGPRAAEIVEEAFLKQLKSQSAYADLVDLAVTKIEKGGAPDVAAKSLAAMMPGIDRDGIEGALRKRAVLFAGIARLRGADAHPALKYFGDEASKLSDEDFKALAKPLRLFSAALSKSKLPPPAPAKRGWAGDKPRM